MQRNIPIKNLKVGKKFKFDISRTEKNFVYKSWKGKHLERNARLQGLFIFIKEYVITTIIQNNREEI